MKDTGRVDNFEKLAPGKTASTFHSPLTHWNNYHHMMHSHMISNHRTSNNINNHNNNNNNNSNNDELINVGECRRDSNYFIV